MAGWVLRGIVLGALAGLAACAGGEEGPLPAAEQQVVAYRDDGPPTIAVVTMINNRSGQGGHSALLVSGSQRVLFDPAGNYRPDYLTEYGDVLYGITDRHLRLYKSAHARATHHVVTQEFVVSPAVAEQALALVQANGRVASAFCANSTSSILRQLPGFQNVSTTFFPHRLMDELAGKPGVVTDRYFENDAGDVVDALAVQASISE